jgi:hypothetical protein
MTARLAFAKRHLKDSDLMKPRLNYLAWMPSVTSYGNLAPSLRWSTVVAASYRRMFFSCRDRETSQDRGERWTEQSTEILDVNLLQSALGWRFTFQQDNDLKHTAKTTQEWLWDKSLNVLEQPPARARTWTRSNIFGVALHILGGYSEVETFRGNIWEWMVIYANEYTIYMFFTFYLYILPQRTLLKKIKGTLKITHPRSEWIKYSY